MTILDEQSSASEPAANRDPDVTRSDADTPDVTDQGSPVDHRCRVGDVTPCDPGQRGVGTHSATAGVAPSSASEPASTRHPGKARSDADLPGTGDQASGDIHSCPVPGVTPLVPVDQKWSDPHSAAVGGDDPPAATDQDGRDTQSRLVGGGASLKDPEREAFDKNLRLFADALNDLEATRIANENRVRSLARSMIEQRDPTSSLLEAKATPVEKLIDAVLAFDAIGPKVPGAKDLVSLASVVESMGQMEHETTLMVQRQVRKHPLGPWVKQAKGVGEKQAGRLLGVLGDPYIVPDLYDRDGNLTAPARIRTVSQLWAYCGYHVLHPGQNRSDSQTRVAGVEPSGSTDHRARDTHAHAVGGATSCDPGHTNPEAHPCGAGVAPSRRKGQKANWNSAAKMRAYLVAERTTLQRCRTCIDAGKIRGEGWAPPPLDCTCADDGYRYRVVYDQTRVKYQDAVHKHPCVRCGPKGSPAPAGSELSDKHKQARAVRAVAKEILKDLWRESKRIHEERAAGA